LSIWCGHSTTSWSRAPAADRGRDGDARDCAASERDHHHQKRGRDISDCLDSLAFCDERIVVDAGSSERHAADGKGKGRARRGA